MMQKLGYIALVVRDYDEAITFYTQSLGFQRIEDTDLGGGKRWVRIRPPGSSGTDLLLAKEVNPEQASRIGNQTGGRVFLFLHTDDFWRDYRAMTGRGVKFVRPPSEESYGTVAVFEDLYGNMWDLLLERIARRLRKSCRPNSLPRVGAARWVGDPSTALQNSLREFCNLRSG